MHLRLLGVVLLATLSLAAASSGQASKAQCDALRKAVAEAQTRYNKAWAAFLTASREYEREWRKLESTQNELDRNHTAIQRAEAEVSAFTNQLKECVDRKGQENCAVEGGRKRSAEERLAKLQQDRSALLLELELDKQRVEQKEEALAAAKADANAAKQALDKAKADFAAAGCKLFA